MIAVLETLKVYKHIRKYAAFRLHSLIKARLGRVIKANCTTGSGLTSMGNK